VGIPLRRGIVLVPEQLLDVVQRHPVLHQLGGLCRAKTRALALTWRFTLVRLLCGTR
jgi:hypothetical protein